MSLQLEAVTFDAAQPRVVAAFWGDLLERDVLDEAESALLRGSPTQVGLRFADAAHSRGAGLDRLHLHLTTADLDDEQQTIETALRLGARHRDVGQLSSEDHTVLADPGGNSFCVIGPDNHFLAGCGRLGEVACDGTRDVGLFWRDALAWPLVWDRDQETAVQSPEGGTKVAWGGPPIATRRGRRVRQHFDLTTTDPDAETLRLVSLGATRVSDRADGVELSDPDGNEFWVRPG